MPVSIPLSSPDITDLEINQNMRSFLDLWKLHLAGQPFQVGTPIPAGAPPVALKEAEEVIHAAKAGVPAPAAPDPHFIRETAIEKFIVRTARLDEQIIAKELGVPVEEIVASAVKMILETRLCLHYWEKNAAVMGAFQAHFKKRQNGQG